MSYVRCGAIHSPLRQRKSPCSEERVGENRGLINFILDIPAQDAFLYMSAGMSTIYNTFYKFNDFSIYRDFVATRHVKKFRGR